MELALPVRLIEDVVHLIWGPLGLTVVVSCNVVVKRSVEFLNCCELKS